MTETSFTILGQPASKANSRQIVRFGDRIASIKSKEARAFEDGAIRQIPPRSRLMLTGPIAVTLRLYYGSERPDLDESVVLDVMQARYRTIGGQRQLIQRGVYLNDRQVREKHVFRHVDRANPRVEVHVRAIEPQQASLLDAVCVC